MTIKKFKLIFASLLLMAGAISSSASAAADVKFEADGTSNINGISASGKTKDKTYYNLSGMRVVSPQEGQVYVKEGKKIWVK